MNPVPDRSAATEEDPRLVRAAQEYLAALEAGRRPTRAEFLARFPGLSEGLAPYLDALDMVHGAGSFAPRPLVQPARPAATELPPAEALGDFHLIREIGRGGMGVVYEAVQLSLSRRVALKVLPFAAALDARHLQRFKNEAQAAAQLHHTNIVPVYAVGYERGTHYYAMQLIEGQNLADMIRLLRPPDLNPRDNSRGSTAGATGPYREPSDDRLEPNGAETAMPARPAPSTALGPAAELTTQHSTRSARFYRTAARLTAQAADALEHAHQFGVIHRDVKPANLIVDERGNVWVTDFGLAQFQTTQGLTRTGDMMGTLRYMSPEQAGGRNALLDARTDVYSLGATFYELITLRPLFDGADTQRLLRQILNDDPRPPRAVDHSIPPELETIVLKAVAKNPADRYPTAGEFADDLRRFLDNRPILARPPTLAQRARKWARRHPSAVVAAVVLCVLTTAGSLVSAWMIHQEQLKTLQREGQAKEELKLARQSVDEMFQISEEELAGNPFTEGVRKRMLMSALGYYQTLIVQSADDPDAQKELAASQERVNKILADLAVLQGGHRADLLLRDDVKLALGLSDDQRSRIDALYQTLAPRRRPPPRAVAPTEWQQWLLEDARTKEAKLDVILTAAQQQRLGQIALQLQGLSAFHDAEVAVDLKLTADQKQQLRAIELGPASTGGPHGEPGRPGRGPGRGPDVQPLVDQFVAGLKPEQKDRWEGMIGERFNGDPQPFGPAPFDHPPGPDGGSQRFDHPPGPDRGPPPRPDGGPPPR